MRGCSLLTLMGMRDEVGGDRVVLLVLFGDLISGCPIINDTHSLLVLNWKRCHYLWDTLKFFSLVAQTNNSRLALSLHSEIIMRSFFLSYILPPIFFFHLRKCNWNDWASVSAPLSLSLSFLPPTNQQTIHPSLIMMRYFTDPSDVSNI